MGEIVPVERLALERKAAVELLRAGGVSLPCRDGHHDVELSLVAHKVLARDGIAVLAEPEPQLLDLRLRLEQQRVPPVARPRCCGEDAPDGLAAHAGDEDGVALLRRDGVKPRAETEVDAADAVFLRGAPRVLQRLPPDVGRDGAVNHAPLPQADRYVAVVGADVGEHSALRHERREQREPRLKR